MVDLSKYFSTNKPSRFVNNDPNSIPQELAAGVGHPQPGAFYYPSSVDNDAVADGAISTAKIQAGAIDADRIAANAVTAAKIAAGSISAVHIEGESINAGRLAAGSVETDKLAANAVTAAKIAANTITANEIAANSITANEIAANAITASEIAADAVTTNKILAANVTSSRIELTLSGKNYGANGTNGTNPGVFFDSASTTGMGYLSSAAQMWLGKGLIISGAGGSWSSALFFGTDVICGSDLIPNANGLMDLGNTSKRWNTVYATNGTINTSDANLKADIANEELGLDFIQSLRPVTYVWKETRDTQVVERAESALDPERFAEEVMPHHRRIQRIRALQRGGRLLDADAEARVSVERKSIEEIESRHFFAIQDAKRQVRRGQRKHHGLIAQEVKEALDAVGVDAAFWQQDAKTGIQGLSYSELVPVLIKAVQELSAEVAELKAAK